ncbi:MAG: hypothetical protein ABW069_13790 [Duganella sp.]
MTDQSCKHCAQPLYTLVPHCPFCGAAGGTVSPPAPAIAPRGEPVGEAGFGSGSPSTAAQNAPPAAAAQPPHLTVVPPLPPKATPTAPPPRAAAPSPPPVHLPESLQKPKEAGARPAAGVGTAAPVDWAAGGSNPPPRSATGPATSSAAGAAPNPRPKRSASRTAAIVVLALVGFFIVYNSFKGRSARDDQACLAAVSQGEKRLTAGDVAGANAQGIRANDSCGGALKSKAENLQADILKVENAATACTRALGAIDDQLDNHELGAARSGLDKLDRRCASNATGKKLRQRLNTASSAAGNATDAARRALAQRDPNAAAKAIDRLAGLNSDASELPGFRASLADLQAAAAAAAAPAAVGTPATAQVPAQAATPAPTTTATTARAPATPVVKPEVHSAKAEMAVGFIQDAETALSQGRFDAARTYIDSARRMDPASPRLDAVARLIRERERQLMQQETTIR